MKDHLLHYSHTKKKMKKGEGEERAGHSEHPTDGASCHGFRVVVAGVAVPMGGRQLVA